MAANTIIRKGLARSGVQGHSALQRQFEHSLAVRPLLKTKQDKVASDSTCPLAVSALDLPLGVASGHTSFLQPRHRLNPASHWPRPKPHPPL